MRASGRKSRKSPSSFAASSTVKKLTPVTLPPGAAVAMWAALALAGAVVLALI